MFWTNFPLRIDATTQIICKIEIIIIVGKKLKLTDVASFSSFFFFFLIRIRESILWYLPNRVWRSWWVYSKTANADKTDK